MTEWDEFDDKPRSGGFLGSVGPKVAFLIVLIALAFLVGVVWNLYNSNSSNDGSIQVPIVRADTDPVKVIPDDRGGMEVAHRDSTIFSTLSGDKKEKKVENLLADDTNEEPLPRSQLFAGLNTEAEIEAPAKVELVPEDEKIDLVPEQPLAEEKKADDKPQQVVSKVTSEIKEVAQAIEKPVQEEVKKIEPVSEKMPTPTTTPAVQKKPEAKPRPKVVTPEIATKSVVPSNANTTGDYVVQLASIKDKSRAESEWKKLSSKYSPTLSGVPYRVEMAILGEKGTFYRIQAGPMPKDSANSICSKIKAINPNGCIVKKK